MNIRIYNLSKRLLYLAVFVVLIWMTVYGALDYNQCQNDVYSDSHCGTVTIIAFVGSQPEYDSNCQYDSNCGTYYLYSLSNGCMLESLNAFQTVNASIQYCRYNDDCYPDVRSQTNYKCNGGAALMICGIVFLAVYSLFTVIHSLNNRSNTSSTITNPPMIQVESNSNV